MNDEEQSQGVEDTSSELETQDNQLEPTPSSDQKQTETEQVEEPQDNSGGIEETDQADKVNPRTEQRIQELLEENKRLKTQQAKEKYGSSVYDSLRPQQTQGQQPQGMSEDPFTNLNQQQVDSITQRFVDEDGNVDIAGLNRALSDANRRADEAVSRAEQIANERIARFEESQQVKEAHSQFPELDPMSDKFDPNFYERVSDALLVNMVKGASQKTLLEVAKELKGSNTPTQEPVNLDKVKQEAVNSYKQAQGKRQQGPIESGHGAPRNTSATLDELRERTRRGDPQAIRERLVATGVISDN